EILGGVIARVGDQVIDGSVQHRLAALQQQLLTGVAGANTDFSPDIDGSAESDGRATAPNETLLANRAHETDHVDQATQAKPGRTQ
ncbi:MAG TPA: F0F1 ATP synthase subunit delta, partial [Ktedonobacteraceae bacterium]|nr:F0F1 ATP synthase subunit delta [Ktedonobacteraceae bacterium]